MNDNIKVSIIIPFYNSREYLNKCLESVINQTLKEVEVLLIDDASSDNSFEIAKTFAEKDNRIKLIKNKKNSGQGYSRNLGIEIAQGEYIAFLDSDDWIEPEIYEKLYNRAKETDADIIKCQFYHVHDQKEEKYRYTNLIKDYDKVYKYSDTPLVLLGQSISFVWNGMYKKSFLQAKKLKFNNTKQSEDALFHWQTTIEAEKLVFMEDYLYYYNKNNAFSETTKIKKRYKDILINIKAIKEFIFKKNLQKELANAFILRCFTFYKFMLSPNLNFFQNRKSHRILMNMINDFDKTKIDEICKQKLASKSSLMRFLYAKNYKIKRTISLLKSRFF